jgi:hypothetical protein
MTEFFGVDVQSVLYGVVVFDALLVLLMGIVAAFMYLIGAEFDVFRDRVVPAVITLVITSLGAGAVLWIATSMFT